MPWHFTSFPALRRPGALRSFNSPLHCGHLSIRAQSARLPLRINGRQITARKNERRRVRSFGRTDRSVDRSFLGVTNSRCGAYRPVHAWNHSERSKDSAAANAVCVQRSIRVASSLYPSLGASHALDAAASAWRKTGVATRLDLSRLQFDRRGGGCIRTTLIGRATSDIEILLADRAVAAPKRKPCRPRAATLRMACRTGLSNVMQFVPAVGRKT